MAEVFHDADLVASDVAAGLILLHREQSEKARDQAHATRVIFCYIYIVYYSNYSIHFCHGRNFGILNKILIMYM